MTLESKAKASQEELSTAELSRSLCTHTFIQRMPIETFTDFFSFDRFQDFENPFEPNPAVSPSYVGSRGRSIVISSPRLWMNFVLDFNQGCPQRQGVELFLELRSEGLVFAL